MHSVSQGDGISVMIVDDSLFMRDMLRKIVETNGYTVVAEAKDGAEGVAKYAELRPRITLIDILMPNKNGVDATREIISIDKYAKVVMCSSLGHEDLIRVALETGARDVIFKPYNVSNVQEVLQKVMQF